LYRLLFNLSIAPHRLSTVYLVDKPWQLAQKDKSPVLKGLGDLGKLPGMLKQAMEMKERIEGLKEQLAEQCVEASVGGGMVTVCMNGKMEMLSIKIDPEIINPADPQTLETLVRAAVNAASEKVRDLVKDKMAEATQGIDLPGII
jgi:nucleoid-associated protein EbfC